MATEINHIPPPSAQVQDVGGHARNGAQPTTDTVDRKEAGPTPGDQVSLTSTAQQLRDLEQKVASQPVVDADRVATVKEALTNGSYAIDPERIAGKMMSLEKALGDLS
ncbi:MAG: flagellar biosynthesis anti-sigma factor FlgM [Gammaproteobacteria bacterium]|jgi:negative regulator of flagellin synthesis FlgM|nr:flagellar biosynthesis anti-sigma factor FlgM [Gammaproteobacteria bacterium]